MNFKVLSIRLLYQYGIVNNPHNYCRKLQKTPHNSEYIAVVLKTFRNSKKNINSFEMMKKIVKNYHQRK